MNKRHRRASFTLDREDSRRFEAMTKRLRLPTNDEAAGFLIMAAIEALEPEDHFVWPLYLVQAGTEIVA